MILTKKLEGREHYVIPTVMIVVGRWCGSEGPVTYNEDVLRESVPYWDGRPVVLYHPSLINHSFAGHPEVFDRQRVGTVFNTNFDGRRLTCDCWIDRERIHRLDDSVAQAIANRQTVEVSTGVVIEFGDHEPQLARKLLPDHLAILPTGRGACSIADGAGLVRNVRGSRDRATKSRNHRPSLCQ